MSTLTLSPRVALGARILVLSAAVLALFCLTACLAAVLLGTVRGTSFLEPSNWSAGIMCSLIAWLFILSFHVRKQSVPLTFTEHDTFVKQLEGILSDLGYEIFHPVPERLVGKPSFAALLFGGTIQVQVGETTATLTGPKLSVERVRTRLRMQSHLDSNRRTLEDSGWKVQRDRLRGAQIQFCVPGEQGPKLAEDIIQALSRLGAIVQCDITLRAQNDAGMEEVLIEKLVRDKLKRKGIAVALHKKPITPASAPETRAAS